MSTPRHAVSTPPKKRSLVARTEDSVPVMESRPLVLPFCPGDVIAGKYEVVGALGAGGVAYVISALHLELGEMVALKFLRPESLAHDEVVSRFASEARAVARIKSEHVAHVYDVGTLSDGAPFIVMEYLEGKDLGVVLAERGSLSIKLAIDYVLQACEALACAHAGGIVHRDVKPDNLFLTQAVGSVEVVKVLDFGISKSALAAVEPGARRRANTMLPMGTPGYMSPEQIRDCGGVDARTDIWSLGCVLSELVTGKSVFDAPTVPQLTATILERDPIPLRKLLPEASQALESLILKCLEKDPARRFQDVAELAVALYPFGPRRARVSAERCHNVLKGQQGMVIELSSVAPPPMSGSNTPMPVSSTGPVVSAVPASLPSPEPVRTSTPATVTMAAALAPKRRTKLLAGAAVALAVATMVLGLNARRFGPSDARAPAAAPPAVASPIATAPPAVVGRGKSKTADEPSVESGAHASASGDAASEPVPTSVQPAKASRIKRLTKTQVTRAAPAASKPVASPKKRAVLDDSEPDVGY